MAVCIYSIKTSHYMKQLYLFVLSCLAFTFPVLAQTTWTGATSTGWNTASNWSPAAVLTASDDVVIPDITNDPVIDAAALAHSVEVQSRAKLDIMNTGSLTINGSKEFDGSTTAFSNQGTVNNSG
jgi:hypothetical protein